jgi:hypothetical protein
VAPSLSSTPARPGPTLGDRPLDKTGTTGEQHSNNRTVLTIIGNPNQK